MAEYSIEPWVRCVRRIGTCLNVGQALTVWWVMVQLEEGMDAREGCTVSREDAEDVMQMFIGLGLEGGVVKGRLVVGPPLERSRDIILQSIKVLGDMSEDEYEGLCRWAAGSGEEFRKWCRMENVEDRARNMM